MIDSESTVISQVGDEDSNTYKYIVDGDREFVVSAASTTPCTTMVDSVAKAREQAEEPFHIIENKGVVHDERYGTKTELVVAKRMLPPQIKLDIDPDDEDIRTFYMYPAGRDSRWAETPDEVDEWICSRVLGPVVDQEFNTHEIHGRGDSAKIIPEGAEILVEHGYSVAEKTIGEYATM